MEKSQNIHIGHCVSPHGIRGEFAFVFYNEDSQVIKENSEIYISAISPDSSIVEEYLKVIITKIRYGNKIIASIQGIETRNQVESLIPFNIYCSRDKLPQLVQDEFYLHDLLGCKVINFITKGEIGTIVSFYENGEQLILQINTGLEKIDILFIKQFVPVVNLESHTVEVIIPEMIE